MNKDIFSNLVCRSMVHPLRIKERDGVSWLIPDTDSSESPFSVDLLSMSNNILMDFFKLGELLEHELAGCEYTPIFLLNAFTKRLQQLGPDKADLRGLVPIFEDAASPFLKENADTVASSIMLFFNKYGVLRTSQLNIDALPGSVMSHVARDAFGPERELNSFSDMAFPISFLAYHIFELYFRYTNPHEYSNAVHKCPPDAIPLRVGRQLRPQFFVSISLSVTYTESDGWHEQKKLESLFDLIALLLFYKDDVLVKKCQYCGTVFITPLESAVYCSPSCRNRANSKKSYERRKAREAL